MKMNQKCARFGGLVITLSLAVTECASTAQTTALTYQGRLTDGGVLANGHYDLTFQLFDTATDGNQVGATLSTSNQVVSDGLFSVLLAFSPAHSQGPIVGSRLACGPTGVSVHSFLFRRANS